MICPDCGNKLSDSALFCRYCGVPVTAGSTSQTACSTPEPAAASTPESAAVSQPEPAAASIPESAAEPAGKKHIGRAPVFLLLFFIFAGGLAVGGCFAFGVWQEYHASYQTAAFAALDEEIAKREDCAGELAQLETRLTENARDARELEAELARYRSLREDELLETLTDSAEFDYDALFATEFFHSAYIRYINDLLQAFQQDALTESWLYSFYDYASEHSADTQLDRDLWVYDSDVLLDPAYFCRSAYTASLSGHFTRNEHLYVTGLDLLITLFNIPGYVLDDAVFVMAYGGSPSPSEMTVPGWGPQDYSDFWESVGSSADSSTAIWEKSGLSAVDFEIDWNQLVDEDAYYGAYLAFMDTIAPGLDRYAMAQYTPDDDYYGGVRYELSGSEASLREIAAAYITGHPECLSELDINTEALPSSFDDQIADVKLQLEKLAVSKAELTIQQHEMTRLLDGRPLLQQQRETLLAMAQQHKTLLTRSLLTFGLICLFLLILTLVSLRLFIRSLGKAPGSRSR